LDIMDGKALPATPFRQHSLQLTCDTSSDPVFDCDGNTCAAQPLPSACRH
jgi:hypothetical protein